MVQIIAQNERSSLDKTKWFQEWRVEGMPSLFTHVHPGISFTVGNRFYYPELRIILRFCCNWVAGGWTAREYHQHQLRLSYDNEIKRKEWRNEGMKSLRKDKMKHYFQDFFSLVIFRKVQRGGRQRPLICPRTDSFFSVKRHVTSALVFFFV